MTETQKEHVDEVGKRKEENRTTVNDPLPEGGWGWVVVAGVFCITVVIQRALGVFFVEWRYYFDATATEVSWAVSMPAAMTGILSPVAGGLCAKFGSRKVVMVGSVVNTLGYLLSCWAKTVVHLYISIGLISSCGTAMMFSPAIVMLGQYFRKRYVLANSIALSGFSISQIVIPRLTQYLIEVYGWRGAMLILSAMGSHSFPCALLLRPRKNASITRPVATKDVKNEHDNLGFTLQESSLQKREMATSTTSLHLFDSHVDKSKGLIGYHDLSSKQRVKRLEHRWSNFTCSNSPLFTLFKSVSFTTLLCGNLCSGVGFFVTVAHLVARGVLAGLSKNDAALLVTGVGIGSLVGRAGHGILIDRKLLSRDIVFIGCFIISAVMNFLNPVMDNFPTLCVFAVITGISNGTISSLMFAILRLQVSTQQAPLALAFGTLVFAISSMAGGVLAGVMFDITGNYDVSFYFAGAMLSVGSLLILVNILYTRKYMTEDQE